MDLVGRGWAHPCTLTPGGAVQLRSGGPELDAAITMIIATAPGERVMRPDFGCTIWELLFDPIDAGTIGLMEHAVREALERWEPRIEVTAIGVSFDAIESGMLYVDVGYSIRGLNDPRNLVFPFYVIPSEPEQPALVAGEG